MNKCQLYCWFFLILNKVVSRRDVYRRSRCDHRYTSLLLTKRKREGISPLARSKKANYLNLRFLAASDFFFFFTLGFS